MASYWKPDLKLDLSLPWRIEMRTTKVYGKDVDRYCAVHGSQEILLDRVTSVLDKCFGKGEALIEWASKQCLLDLACRFLPGNDDNDAHLAYWDKATGTVEKILDRKSVRLASGRIKRGKQWTFGEVATQFSYNMPPPVVPPHFSWPWLGEMLQEATKARYRSLEKAGQLGTRAHELIEMWCKAGGALEYTEGGKTYLVDLDDEAPEVQSAMKAFWQFWDEHEFHLFATEQKLFDLCLGIAGTCDCLVRPADDPDSLWLLDWKTSKGIYADKFLQVAAYGRMCERTPGIGWPSKAYLVRFDKHTAQFESVPVWQDRLEFIALAQCWGFAVQLSRFMENTEKYLKSLREG